MTCSSPRGDADTNIVRTATTEALAHAATYVRFSGPLIVDASDLETPALIEAQLRKALHRIEKGLTLARPRRPFGATFTRDLVDLVDLACERYGPPVGSSLASSVRQARRALASLRSWNEEGTHDDLSAYEVPSSSPGSEGDAVKKFFESRHSTRNFVPGALVSEAELNNAVQTALASPSVCNRATGRVHLYRGVEMVAELFALQQGNRGLDGVQEVAIVTTSLQMFTGADEFVQPWIDGGIFAMNLVWGFEQQGIGTCFLNWSMPHETSGDLRHVANIPDDELVITLIAFGFAVESLRVTASEKPPINAVMTRHRTQIGARWK